MVQVITSDFQLGNPDKKELNWQIVNLTAILINRNVDRLAHDLVTQNSQNSQINAIEKVTTIDLSNDFNEFLQPTHLKNYVSFSEDDLFNGNLFYWQAPEQYLGNKLYSYDNELQFKLSYSVLRGDVASNKCDYSGDADVLVAGVIEDRLKFIGFKWTRYQKKFRCDWPITIRIMLKEQFWFQLDEKLKLTKKTVSRLDFGLIFNSLRLLLIRASYHSDQIEARLYTVTMGIIDPTEKVKGTFQGKHFESCMNCGGNSEGLFCEKCKLGYYGNPITNDHCRPCECPSLHNTSTYHADECMFDRQRNRQVCKVNFNLKFSSFRILFT